MALTLRVKAGQATFSMTDGAMKAEWTLTTSMDEAEIMEALLGMLRYVRQQPVPADVVPLHVVPDPPDVVYLDNMPKISGPPVRDVGQRLTWAPAVKPVPLEDSLMAAQQSGFEPIPPDELED